MSDVFNIEKYEIKDTRGCIWFYDTQKEAQEKALEAIKEFRKGEKEPASRFSIYWSEDHDEVLLFKDGSEYAGIIIECTLMSQSTWDDERSNANRTNIDIWKDVKLKEETEEKKKEYNITLDSILYSDSLNTD